MKFYTSAIVAALLVASSPHEAQAIRLACPGSGDQNPAEESDGTKTIKKAMDKFVAKHNEIATRQQNRKRTDDKLNEVEEKETKGKHQKKEHDEAKEVAKEIEHAEAKKEKQDE